MLSAVPLSSVKSLQQLRVQAQGQSLLNPAETTDTSDSLNQRVLHHRSPHTGAYRPEHTDPDLHFDHLMIHLSGIVRNRPRTVHHGQTPPEACRCLPLYLLFQKLITLVQGQPVVHQSPQPAGLFPHWLGSSVLMHGLAVPDRSLVQDRLLQHPVEAQHRCQHLKEQQVSQRTAATLQ